MMELHHRSCVLPSNAPALSVHESGSIIRSRVLREHSGNRQHNFADSSASWKRSSSASAENVHSLQLGRGCFAGSFTAHQHYGERTEAQIYKETERVLSLLPQCEKYQKYRERQPKTKKQQADKQKWPDELERAFFRALVRWLPMGRKKLILDGAQRGRNELVAASITSETGVLRDRKQVSSHIQVLKTMFEAFPLIYFYMYSPESRKKDKHRHSSSHLSRRNHTRTRSSKYNFSQSPYLGYGALPPSLPLPGLHLNESDAAFAVSSFAMRAECSEEPIHDFTRLTDDSRVGDINVTETRSWYQQYPEFRFLDTTDFQERCMLVCDARIRMMTEKLPTDSALTVVFNVDSQLDLSIFESLECRTRFYDKVNDHVEICPQPFENREVEESRAPLEYTSGHSGSRMKVKFGSNFWVHRLHKCRVKMQEADRAHVREDHNDGNQKEAYVRHLLRNMTAVQDIYGRRRDTRQDVCFLTILWRFSQTRTSHEPGKMTWRRVNFLGDREEACADGQEWVKSEDLKLENVDAGAKNSIAAVSPNSISASTFPSLQPLGFPQPFAQHPLQLDLDNLSTITSLENMTEFSNPISATVSTEFSQTQSLPSLSHNQDTTTTQCQEYHDVDDFDFNGHITMDCLEPAIDLGAYESYVSHAQPIHSLSALASLTQEHTPSNANAFVDLSLGVGVTMGECYSTKPSWHHPDMVSRFEGMAEQHDLLDQINMCESIAGQGVLHDGQLGHGLWKLQAGFPGNASIGSNQRDTEELRQGHGHDILEMIERDQRRDSFRDY